jgi:hypothetical protein
MSKQLLVVALCFSYLATPVFAADSESTEQKAGIESDSSSAKTAAAKPTKAASSNSWLGGTGKMGVRFTSVVAGSTLGIPVAAVRVFANCEVEHAKAIPLIGERTNKGCVWLSRAAVIPSAMFVAIFGAPYYSTINSWKESSEKPFSKECFGLGRFDDSICPP